MSPTNPRPQATFFYTDEWTEAVDNWFIEKLAQLAIKKNELLTWLDAACVRIALNDVNDLFDTSFSFSHAASQFEKLSQRHTVFSFITSLDHVYYDETANKVHAFSKYVWDYVVLKYSLGEAYMLKGEPAWDHLCAIFGTPDHLKTPRAPEIVDLVTPTKSVSTEVHTPVETWPRETFNLHSNSSTTSFWEDLAQFGYENITVSSASVQAASQSTGDTLSFTPPPLIPRSLWPKPGSTLYVDSPRPKDTSKRVREVDDHHSSTASSTSYQFDPFGKKGQGSSGC